jgi:hypothetical protein
MVHLRVVLSAGVGKGQKIQLSLSVPDLSHL